MYPHLQTILTEIEQEAEARSRIAAANADLIERAGTLVDTLNRGNYPVADMCLHWHYDPELHITVQPRTNFDKEKFSDALRGAGIDVSQLHEIHRHGEGSGNQFARLELEKNICLNVAVEHLPAQQKAAA